MRFLLTCFFISLAAAAQAQDEGRFDFGGDSFAAGQTVVHDRQGTDDLFLAGQRTRVSADTTGSVLAAAQDVRIEAAVGGDVYAAAQEIAVTGDVSGDATLFGQDVLVSGAVGANLRVAGDRVEVTGPVGGHAIVAGNDVLLDAAIAGDVSLGAASMEFGENARIDGTLFLYEEEIGALEVPGSVVPDDRITRIDASEWDEDIAELRPVSFGELLGRFIAGVLMVAVIASLIAAVVPDRLAEMRQLMLEQPFWTLWIGFLALSAVVGSLVVLGLTLIGLVLAPGIVLLAMLGALVGYVVGAYAFGVGLLLLAGREVPDQLSERVIAAGVGALVAGLAGLVPFLGWIFVLALSLAGLGAITIRTVQPGFFRGRAGAEPGPLP